MRTAKTRTRAIGELMGEVLAPALNAHGIATSEIVARWPDIVGRRFEEVTQPLRVVWPRRGRMAAPDAPADRGTLVVLVEGAHALEFQYAAAGVLERVNAFYGYAAIEKLSLRQGPVARRPVARAAPRPAAPVAPERIAAVEDEDLRRALFELGRSVAGAAPKVTGS